MCPNEECPRKTEILPPTVTEPSTSRPVPPASSGYSLSQMVGNIPITDKEVATKTATILSGYINQPLWSLCLGISNEECELEEVLSRSASICKAKQVPQLNLDQSKLTLQMLLKELLQTNYQFVLFVSSHEKDRKTRVIKSTSNDPQLALYWLDNKIIVGTIDTSSDISISLIHRLVGSTDTLILNPADITKLDHKKLSKKPRLNDFFQLLNK